MSQFPPFSIISARSQWINGDGTPTPDFFKLILNMLNAGGGGQTGLVDVFQFAGAGFATEDVPVIDSSAKLLAFTTEDTPAKTQDASLIALAFGDDFSGQSSGAVTSVTSVNADIGVSPTTGAVVLTLNTGTSGHKVPYLDGSGLAWSGAAAMSINGAGGLLVGFGLACTTFSCAAGSSSSDFTIGGNCTISGNNHIGGSETISGSLNVTGGVSANSGAFSGLNSTNYTTTNETVSGSFVCSAGSNAAMDALIVNTAFGPTNDNSISCGSAGKRFTDVFAVSGSVNPSDPALKQNMEPVPPSLGIVESVAPITWEWAKPDWRDGRTHWGFNAITLSEAVAKTGLDWAGHMVDEAGGHNLRYHEIIPILWQAVRELSAKVSALEGAR